MIDLDLYIIGGNISSSFLGSVSSKSMLIEYFRKNNKPIFSSYLKILPEFTGITNEEEGFIENEKIGLIVPLSYKDEILSISFLKIREESFIEDPEIWTM